MSFSIFNIGSNKLSKLIKSEKGGKSQQANNNQTNIIQRGHRVRLAGN